MQYRHLLYNLQEIAIFHSFLSNLLDHNHHSELFVDGQVDFGIATSSDTLSEEIFVLNFCFLCEVWLQLFADLIVLIILKPNHPIFILNCCHFVYLS